MTTMNRIPMDGALKATIEALLGASAEASAYLRKDAEKWDRQSAKGTDLMVAESVNLDEVIQFVTETRALLIKAVDETARPERWGESVILLRMLHNEVEMLG